MYSRYVVHTQDGTYQAYAPRLSGWTHVVLNYIQPNNTEGIKIFYKGAKMGGDFSKWNVSLPSGDSRIVVGRRRTDRDNGYASVQIDELTFFNQYLSIEEIRKLRNAV